GRRVIAAASGFTLWEYLKLVIQTHGLGDSAAGRRLEAVLMANRSTGNKDLLPLLLLSSVGHWQQPARFEMFVSTQRVEDQADDFSRVAERGGAAMFFMVTWGYLDRDGGWQTGQFVAHDLSSSAEANMITAWQAELNRLANLHGVALQNVRLFHWGSRETLLPDLNWFSILDDLIHEGPVAVRGAFGSGLVEMAQAFHALGLIESALPDQPRDPQAA